MLLVAGEEVLDQLRRQQRQPQHPADGGRVNLIRPGDLLDRRVPAGLQHLLPAEGAGDGFHERAGTDGRHSLRLGTSWPTLLASHRLTLVVAMHLH
jgi:hypothetical protein